MIQLMDELSRVGLRTQRRKQYGLEPAMMTCWVAWQASAARRCFRWMLRLGKMNIATKGLFCSSIFDTFT